VRAFGTRLLLSWPPLCAQYVGLLARLGCRADFATRSLPGKGPAALFIYLRRARGGPSLPSPPVACTTMAEHVVTSSEARCSVQSEPDGARRPASSSTAARGALRSHEAVSEETACARSSRWDGLQACALIARRLVNARLRAVARSRELRVTPNRGPQHQRRCRVGLGADGAGRPDAPASYELSRR